MRERSRGFSLIELMAVVAIVAIATTVAVSSYQNQTRQGRRTDAKTALLDLASREEKYFSLNNTYTASPASLGYQAVTSTVKFPQTVGSGYYQIFACPGTTIDTACNAAVPITTTGSTFVIAAIPVSSTPQAKDTTCSYLAIDNTGTEYATGSGGVTTTTCWP